MDLISVKDRQGGYKHHKVPSEVYIYIKQLEAYINYPEESKLKELYVERFYDKPKQREIIL
tara:strand:- start:1973 stop:2155 length:183 start_codon:yes stop_codon:yes gene_type:complete